MIQDTSKFLKEKLKNLENVMRDFFTDLSQNPDVQQEMKKYNIDARFMEELKTKARNVVDVIPGLLKMKDEAFFRGMRKFILLDFGTLVDLLKMLFTQILFYASKQNLVKIVSSAEGEGDFSFSFMGGHYLVIISNYKIIRQKLNQFFFKDIKLMDELVVDERTELWQTAGMQHWIFPSEFLKTRQYASVVTEPVKGKTDEQSFSLLTQQASELIKNAIKHGNHNDPSKIVKVWFSYDGECYKLIVEDEGEGFKDLEKWNEFNRKRDQALFNQDMESMMSLISWRSDHSDEDDGGNALICALEYWDSGLIYNQKKSKVLAIKYFYVE